jgi:hypothetical protein
MNVYLPHTAKMAARIDAHEYRASIEGGARTVWMGTSSISSDFLLSIGSSVVASSTHVVVGGAVSCEMVPRALDLNDIADDRNENAMNQWMMSCLLWRGRRWRGRRSASLTNCFGRSVILGRR